MQGSTHASEPVYPVHRTHVPMEDLSTSQQRHLERLSQRTSIFKNVHLRANRRDAYVSDIINVQSLLNVRAMESQRRKRRISGSFHDRIIINVCGDRFETHQTTLELYPQTLLGNPRRRQFYYDKNQNEYFFDRNRACFEAILYYYQSYGRLRRPTFVPLDTFLEEVTFFDLGMEALDQIRKDENLEEVKKILLPHHPIRRCLWATMEYPEYSLLAKIVNMFSVFMILLSTICLAVETLPQYVNMTDSACQGNYQQPNSTSMNGSSSNNGTTNVDSSICMVYFINPFFIIQTVCIGYFTLEFILRLIATPSLLSFIKDLMTWIDIVAIAPYYITLGLRLASRHKDFDTSTYAGLRVLRILRFIRILKVYRAFKSIKSLRVLAATIKESIPDFFIMISILSLLAFLFGAGAYFAENASNGDEFDSILKATYWGIMTITSVGYGDLTPITAIGRILACLCALFGAATIGMLVSVLVDRYQRVYSRKLYIQEEPIDFDDYTEEDNVETASHRSSQLFRRQNSLKIEDPDARAKHEASRVKINEAFEQDENNQNKSELSENYPLSQRGSRARFIVGYIDNAEEQTSNELLDQISSIVAEKRTPENAMTFSLIRPNDLLSEPRSPDVEFHLAPFYENSDDDESLTEITTGNRSKGNVLKCFRRRSTTSDNDKIAISTKAENKTSEI